MQGGVMKNNQSAFQWFGHFIAASVLALGLAGCSGDDGAPGAAGVPGPGVASLSDATALNITVTKASINSAPVVNFSVTNQDGVAVAGFADSDLRFNIAKLVPGSNGAPSKWQSYLNRVSGGGVLGTQERVGTGYVFGTLVDHKNGTFTYTFATDITNAAANPCPAPCTDAEGNALNISYQAGLTHRIGIQQNNTALPKANATYDFVPAGGAVVTKREIVQTATCNECHNQLAAHGGGMRIETKLCVTCHNPGSWDNTPGNVQTVDFKVMIHKIHQGAELPSVKAGTPYAIGSQDFSNVVFPYSAVRLGDTRSCAKCHDGAVTAQGDNWKTQPSRAACSSCHDDVYFGGSPDPLKPYQTVSHETLSGTTTPDDSNCTLCHGAGQAQDVVVKHDLPNLLKTEAAKYQFNVESVANTTAGGVIDLQVVFSVTNPTVTPATYYNIKTDPAFACVAGTGLPASVSVLVGWNNTDENNSSSGNNPGQPYTASVLDTYTSGTGLCANNANVGDNGNGTFTATLAGKRIPTGMTGSGRAAVYGRISKDVDGNGTKENVRIKAGYNDYGISGSPATARRTVVDIAKCDKCHDQVSLHGDSRTNEPGLCVICHNPSATDINRRPRATQSAAVSPGPCAGQVDALGNPALANAVICDPLVGGSKDSKKEEAIDFKRMIHGIHAASKTDYTGAPADGFRNKGLVVYGYYSGAGPANPIDFSHVRFPGVLNDCLTCHTTYPGSTVGTYELTKNWEVPTASGVLGSSINTAPLTTDSFALQTDDLNITPTAGVCSSCHDGDVAKSHMTLNGALFAADQATINSGVTLEACAICHGPGRVADVKVIHGVK